MLSKKSGAAAGTGKITVWPASTAWIWLFGVGLFATISQLIMTYALSYAPPTTLAPRQYFELPVATFFGYLVFGDFPNSLGLLGMSIIIGAGLYMTHREHIVAKPPTRLSGLS